MNGRMQKHKELVNRIAVAALGEDLAKATGLYAVSPSMSSQDWEEIRHTCDLIQKPEAGEAVHKQYSTDERPEVRACVARVCPHQAVTDTMVDDSDICVLEALARNKAVSTKTLKTLMSSTSWDVHAAIAQNPTADVEIQKQLLDHKSNHVREELAENEHLEPGVAAVLYERGKKAITGPQKNGAILNALARNSRTPKDVLKKIEGMAETHNYLAQCANRTLAELA